MNIIEMYRQTTNLLDGETRLFLGIIGSLLIEANLAIPAGEWQKANGGSSITYSKAYALPINRNFVFNNLSNEYAIAHTSYVRNLLELRRLEREKKSSQAKNLWDDA